MREELRRDTQGRWFRAERRGLRVRMNMSKTLTASVDERGEHEVRFRGRQKSEIVRGVRQVFTLGLGSIFTAPLWQLCEQVRIRVGQTWKRQAVWRLLR